MSKISKDEITQYNKNNMQTSIPLFSQHGNENELYNTISPIYTDILDIKYILDAAWKLLKTSDNELRIILNNNFIQTCDIETLEKFEVMCGIDKNDKLDIEFRRQNILNIFAEVLPYTLPKLKELLNTVAGVGNWNLEQDFNSYSLSITIFESFTDIIEMLRTNLITYLPAHINWNITKNIQINSDGGEYLGGYTYQHIVLEMSDMLDEKSFEELINA